MILAALALAAAAQVTPPAPVPETEEGRAAACQATVRRSPQEALAVANRWQAAGGGLLARQCVGLAYAALEQWTNAATIYEQAAQEAQRASDSRAPDFWVQAGNAWLAGGDPARALLALDTALSLQGITPELQGEVHLDRARAFVAQGDPARARENLDRALELVPRDPMVWYLSAALALRQDDIARARTDIARARQMAANDPDVMLLAGTIAGRAGDMAEAERLYRQVADRFPDSDAGRAAAASLQTARDVETPAPH
ncbi:tetratricopeptide repeat protein [Sphingosinicella sp. YJ22]|uniref:tetratricopeptide repeat protein n=1 Tax=Sphingosinicella sp. YJ22 TaxID=1104780 RepID=UPI00140C8804|nr:tetratricopeptide repeat protein [Sphingosinicella sp. YJ22]